MQKNNLLNNSVVITSFILMFISLIGIINLHLVSLMFSIILTYIFMDKISFFITKTTQFLDEEKKYFKFLTPNAIKIISSLTIGILLIIVFILFSTWLVNFLSPSNLQEMFTKIENILEAQKNSRYLPDFVYQYLPNDLDDLKNQTIDLLKKYASEIKNIGKSGLMFIAYIILGTLIGIMLNISKSSNNCETIENKILKKYLIQRIKNFKESFELIFLAQMKISLVNTILTAIYIYVALPIFNYEMPFKTTVVLLTFLFGLIPVLGNLISNTIIIVLSLGININVSIASLIFLVVVHKLEYFLDAKIIGEQIEAKTWEILLTLIIFETLFGISGVIVSSIYYCYLKMELKKYELI